MKRLVMAAFLLSGILLLSWDKTPAGAGSSTAIPAKNGAERLRSPESSSTNLQALPFFQKPEDPVLSRSTLSEEDRLMGLSLLWSETRFGFAYFDRVAAIWNSLYLEFIPRVRSAKTDFEYFLELMRFQTHLQDGHSGVFWPYEFNQALGYPPLEIRKVEGRAVVFRLLRESKELKQNGIRPGLAIVEVDGRPVSSLVACWRELMRGSTEQATDRLDYFRILTGPRNSAVEVLLEEPGGASRKVHLNRSESYFGDLNLDPVQYHATRRYDPGLGYFQANQMNEEVAQAFARFVESQSGMKGLILDLRYNGGGSDLVSFDMVSRLIDKPLAGPIYEATSYRADRRAEREEQEIIRTVHPNITPAKGRPFTGWLLVLIGEQTGSATEGGFLSVIRNRPQTIFLGEPTAGSTGQPLAFRLPGGGTGVVCSRRSLAPDGSAFVGTGIKPDIRLSLSQQDLFRGRDGVLEKALEILRERISTVEKTQWP